MSSFICKILSALDFYLLIKNKRNSKYNVLTKVNYKVFALLIFIFSLCLFSFRLFDREIGYKINNDNSTEFKLIKTNFTKTAFSQAIDLIAFICLHGVNCTLLVTINLLIYFKVKKTIKMKRYLQSNRSNSNVNDAENSVKLMVVLAGLMNIVGKGPSLVFFIYNAFESIEEYASVFIILFETLYYSFHFFLYFLTNKIFKHLVCQHANNILIILKIKHRATNTSVASGYDTSVEMNIKNRK